MSYPLFDKKIRSICLLTSSGTIPERVLEHARAFGDEVEKTTLIAPENQEAITQNQENFTIVRADRSRYNRKDYYPCIDQGSTVVRRLDSAGPPPEPKYDFGYLSNIIQSLNHGEYLLKDLDLGDFVHQTIKHQPDFIIAYDTTQLCVATICGEYCGSTVVYDVRQCAKDEHSSEDLHDPGFEVCYIQYPAMLTTENAAYCDQWMEKYTVDRPVVTQTGHEMICACNRCAIENPGSPACSMMIRKAWNDIKNGQRATAKETLKHLYVLLQDRPF